MVLVHILLIAKRQYPLIFQVRGSKVKVTCYTQLLNFVNTIQIEPFQLGPPNFVHIHLMTRGGHLLIFKVRGQRSRQHTRHSCKTLLLNFVNTIQTESFQPATAVKLGTHTSYDKRTTPIDFQVQGSKVKVTL